MSGKHKKQKSRSLRHTEESKSHKKTNMLEKKHEIEGNTPPLPKNLHSLEELMKHRETLKEELGRLDAKPDKTTKGTKRKHSAAGNKNSKLPKINILYSPKKAIKTRKKTQNSPEYNADRDLESEDEESIIELRRQQRKQLLEKFNESDRTHKSSTIKENPKLIAPSSKKLNNEMLQVENTNTTQLSDMFSEKDDFIPQNNPGTTDTKDENNAQLNDNWDDAEGYLNVRPGDTLKKKYVLKEILGKGVFAVVIHAQDTSRKNSAVAIKCVRNNDLMYRTSLKEIAILKEINQADPESKYHCVKYICDFMHKQHLCIVLEALHMDLRGVIKKYGKNHGIHMKALISYSRQLLLALRLLRKIGIVHYDIKPDNILVNEKKNILKLCDFGSAAKVDENEPTPYLVSRFYRAPEIILGIKYSHSVDIWSTACTIFEMATGRILFTGSSNNRMIKCFMDLKGKIPVRLLKKGKFKDQHFNYNNNFLLHKKDAHTGRDTVTEICNSSVSRDLYKELLKSCKSINFGEEIKRNQLKDLLDKMLMLDPSQRHTVTDCLKHSFIQDPLLK